jgi:hypothetical protein
MDERLKLVARLLNGEKMAPLCREFGISRVTGYKIFNRYKAAAWMVCRIEVVGPIVMPISCLSRSNGRHERMHLTLK